MNFKKLGEFISIVKGKKVNTIYSSPINLSKRFIQIDDLRNNNNIKYTNEPGTLVSNDDILIAWDGANAGTIGYGLNGIIGSTIAVLRINNNKIMTTYLGRFLKTKSYYLRNNCSGATIPHIRREVLEDISIPIPETISEQEYISNILDKADSIFTKRKESIGLADEFLRSTFLDMFGDPLSNPMGWKMENIKNLVPNDQNAIKAGPFGSALKKEFYVAKGYKIYGQEQVIKDDFEYGDYYINEDKYKELESYKIKSDDILISLVGTYGKISIVPKKHLPGIINPRLMKITFDTKKINPVYFKYLFNSDAIRKKLKSVSHGGTMDIVNVTIIKDLDLPVPDIYLQNKYCDLVLRIERMIKCYKYSLTECENLYSSLMQRAFKGELS